MRSVGVVTAIAAGLALVVLWNAPTDDIGRAGVAAGDASGPGGSSTPPADAVVAR